MRQAGDWPHRCSSCMKSFWRVSDATAHLRRAHTGGGAQRVDNLQSVFHQITLVADSADLQQQRLPDREPSAASKRKRKAGAAADCQEGPVGKHGLSRKQFSASMSDEERDEGVIAPEWSEESGQAEEVVAEKDASGELRKLVEELFSEPSPPRAAENIELAEEHSEDVLVRSLSPGLSLSPVTASRPESQPISPQRTVTGPPTPTRVYEAVSPAPQSPPAPCVPVLTGLEVEQRILARMLFGSPGRALVAELAERQHAAQYQAVLDQLRSLGEALKTQGQCLVRILAELKACREGDRVPRQGAGGDAEGQDRGAARPSARASSRWEFSNSPARKRKTTENRMVFSQPRGQVAGLSGGVFRPTGPPPPPPLLSRVKPSDWHICERQDLEGREEPRELRPRHASTPAPRGGSHCNRGDPARCLPAPRDWTAETTTPAEARAAASALPAARYYRK